MRNIATTALFGFILGCSNKTTPEKPTAAPKARWYDLDQGTSLWGREGKKGRDDDSWNDALSFRLQHPKLILISAEVSKTCPKELALSSTCNWGEDCFADNRVDAAASVYHVTDESRVVLIRPPGMWMEQPEVVVEIKHASGTWEVAGIGVSVRTDVSVKDLNGFLVHSWCGEASGSLTLRGPTVRSPDARSLVGYSLSIDIRLDSKDWWSFKGDVPLGALSNDEPQPFVVDRYIRDAQVLQRNGAG